MSLGYQWGEKKCFLMSFVFIGLMVGYLVKNTPQRYVEYVIMLNLTVFNIWCDLILSLRTGLVRCCQSWGIVPLGLLRNAKGVACRKLETREV